MTNPIKSALARLRPGDGSTPLLSPALTKNIAPIVTLAIGITALIMMVMWQDQSSYKPVFGAREKVVAADMMSVLEAEHISYRVHPDSGQVMVPSSMLGKVRMLLAAKGVTAQLPAGLELMDKNDPLGVSQFVQDVRFRRGLEGELAQSIMTLDAIATARVHLSIAKSTSFVSSDGDKSSASVVISTKPGRKLSNETIAAIVNMVSGSVASLSPARVSLVDQTGNLLSSHVDMDEGFDPGSAGNEHGKRAQEDIRTNIKGLLGPIVGDENFKVSVTAVVNNDRIEETVEKFGSAPKVTSEAMRDEQDRNRLVMGVPGTLSNRPPPADAKAGTDGTKTADGKDTEGGGDQSRKNATTRQYAYDRSITQTKHARGQLEKQNIAVVLAHAAAPFPKTGWSAAELANIDKVLRNGLGIDDKRGDTLVVTAMNFPAKPAPAPWWQERETVVDYSLWLTYAIGALLAFFLFVRPMLKLLMNVVQAMLPKPAVAVAAGPEQVTLRAPSDRRGAGAAAGEAAGAAGAAHGAQQQLPGQSGAGPAHAAPALGGAEAANAMPGGVKPGMPVVPLLENYDLPPTGSSVDVMVDHLKILAEKEPERVAEVVKQWMQKNGRPQ
ncbi:flagellar M-ring protein FliF [Duganella sp. FT92W]|uniref:Flagellar M-ring protein n=1 Tax=Pseudoduganella rivuli TaxID=2666085 RepID=A0A7X2IRN7_9BURK|nr:flagellar M-ring protein FliF [Pseudoduganella rivuli]